MNKELNGYDLSRAWFDFCYENPEKIKPNHAALYFFAIEHCNRLGWKKVFGLPTTMTMEAIGIRSYNTYKNTLDDLVKWKFITMVEVSKNQYSSNKIAISNFNKALNNALDKALITHATKHSESTIESIDSVDKPITTNQEQKNNKQIDFDLFWVLYDKKVDKVKCEAKWKKLSKEIQQKILDYLPDYVKSTPNKDFRKNPATFLNNKSWENEIILKNSNTFKPHQFDLSQVDYEEEF